MTENQRKTFLDLARVISQELGNEFVFVAVIAEPKTGDANIISDCGSVGITPKHLLETGVFMETEDATVLQ